MENDSRDLAWLCVQTGLQLGDAALHQHNVSQGCTYFGITAVLKSLKAQDKYGEFSYCSCFLCSVLLL